MNLIWQQCISCLEGEISEQQLNTWILPLQVEQDPNTLKLLAPNRFVMDWVRKHFLERIRELAGNYLEAPMIWLVVGDAETQFGRLGALELGDPIRLDRDGNVLQ